MRTKEEIMQGVSEMLRSLRERKGLSRNRMAELVGVNAHTWTAWETGRSAPSIVDFISIFERTGENMMRPALSLLYPETYDSNTDTRSSMEHFIGEVASDHTVDVLSFLAYGCHGSNFISQVEMFCAYNHLPMEQRFALAELTYILYNMSRHRDDLIATDSIMPDMTAWEDGLKASQKAAYKRMQSYTTLDGKEIP